VKWLREDVDLPFEKQYTVMLEGFLPPKFVIIILMHTYTPGFVISITLSLYFDECKLSYCNSLPPMCCNICVTSETLLGEEKGYRYQTCQVIMCTYRVV
jgi:cytochrome c oxidase subunit IV